MSQWHQHWINLSRKILLLGLPGLVEPNSYSDKTWALKTEWGGLRPVARAEASTTLTRHKLLSTTNNSWILLSKEICCMRPEMVLQLHTCLPHVHLLGGITWTTLYDHGDHLCFWAFPLCMNTATIVSMLTHKLRKKDWHSEILSLEIWMISYSVHWSEMYYSIWLEVFEKKKLDLT